MENTISCQLVDPSTNLLQVFMQKGCVFKLLFISSGPSYNFSCLGFLLSILIFCLSIPHRKSNFKKLIFFVQINTMTGFVLVLISPYISKYRQNWIRTYIYEYTSCQQAMISFRNPQCNYSYFFLFYFTSHSLLYI